MILKQYNFIPGIMYCIGSQSGYIFFASGENVQQEIDFWNVELLKNQKDSFNKSVDTLKKVFNSNQIKTTGVYLERVQRAVRIASEFIPLQNREIKEEYTTKSGEIAVIVEGTENANFWDIEEYKAFKGIPATKEPTKLTPHNANKSMQQISIQAATDYKQAKAAYQKCKNKKGCVMCRFKTKYSKTCEDMMHDVETYFRDSLFGAAFQNLDPEYIIQHLDEITEDK